MAGEKRRAIRKWVAWAMVFVVVAYPLSYAPVVRWELERQGRLLINSPAVELPRLDGTVFPVYKPVDWLIDNTPLQKPLFVWAGLWGVEYVFDDGAYQRS